MCPENLHKHIINLHVLVKYAWWKDQKFLTIFSIYTDVCFVTSSETPMCQYPSFLSHITSYIFIGKEWNLKPSPKDEFLCLSWIDLACLEKNITSN